VGWQFSVAHYFAMARSAAMALAALSVVMLGLTSLVAVEGQQVVTLTVQYDNRGSRVMDKSVNDKIIKALAESVFMVPVSQVALVGGVGQSSLINHKSVAVYQAVGPTSNGKSLLKNCEAATKSGIFSSSAAYKAVKKATDTWMPGDKVKIESATCKAAGAVATQG